MRTGGRVEARIGVSLGFVKAAFVASASLSSLASRQSTSGRVRQMSAHRFIWVQGALEEQRTLFCTAQDFRKTGPTYANLTF